MIIKWESHFFSLNCWMKIRVNGIIIKENSSAVVGKCIIILQCLHSKCNPLKNWQSVTDWLFLFSLIVVAKAFLILSTPLFLFLTMTEPRCIQGRNLIAKAYFSQYSQNPLESKQFLIFEESRNWPVWEMNSMFHIKSLFYSNLNTLWRPPSFHFILPFNFNWRIVDIRKTWKSKANLMFSFQFCCCCPSSLNKIGVFMASTWNSIGVTTTCKLDQSSSALHLCWAMTIPAARNVTVELRKKWGQFCNSTHTII